MIRDVEEHQITDHLWLTCGFDSSGNMKLFADARGISAFEAFSKILEVDAHLSNRNIAADF
jgi:hypothetical protein